MNSPYFQKYGEANPAYKNGYRGRIRDDIQEVMYQLNRRMAGGMRASLKRNKGGLTWAALVPYTLTQLHRHLKRSMPHGYTWADLADLHIDHIIPKSVFRFTSPTDVEFQRCWALKNLRLLPAAENMRKKSKLLAPFQPTLL